MLWRQASHQRCDWNSEERDTCRAAVRSIAPVTGLRIASCRWCYIFICDTLTTRRLFPFVHVAASRPSRFIAWTLVRSIRGQNGRHRSGWRVQARTQAPLEYHQFEELLFRQGQSCRFHSCAPFVWEQRAATQHTGREKRKKAGKISLPREHEWKNRFPFVPALLPALPGPRRTDLICPRPVMMMNPGLFCSYYYGHMSCGHVGSTKRPALSRLIIRQFR